MENVIRKIPKESQCDYTDKTDVIKTKALLEIEVLDKAKNLVHCEDLMRKQK